MGETEKKAGEARHALATKQMTPLHRWPLIVPFSNQFRRDVPALYGLECRRLLGH